MRRRKLSILLAITVATVTLCATAHAKETVLYRFTGEADGASPSSSLVFDAAGNLYGTALNGGDLSQCYGMGCGVVFELSPTQSGSWAETVLYAFQGSADGGSPSGNLLLDASGNLYGTAQQGGSVNANCPAGCGVVFELSPTQNGSWTETVLYTFAGGTDGFSPQGLIFDAAGNLYGTTPVSVYKLSPPKQPGAAWTEKTLFDFGERGRSNPGLIFGNSDTLYGTYYNTGFQFCVHDIGCGAVYEVERAQGKWTETDLYDFLGYGNGGQPAAGVIRDSQGNLYGTGAEGGNNWGIVFKVWRSGEQWKERMLYNFCSRNNCADGALPLAGLVMDSDGVLYGTTYGGGIGVGYGGSGGNGVVFKLEPANNGWKETVLHRFRGGKSDGWNPQESLILDQTGNLYGVANTGYGEGAGIVFEVTP